MITILGATGNVGGKIADILIQKGEKIRLVARSIERLRAKVSRRAQAMAGDARDTEFLVQAFSGSSAVFSLIPPNITAGDFLAYADEIGGSIARALELAGVTHVVNLSSIGAELDQGTGPIVGLHRQEERLNRVPGLNVLHLRAAFFMENLLMNIEMIRSRGMNGGPLKGDLKLPMIATRDIASFAAVRLPDRDFSGQSVQYLLGRNDLSMNEATMKIGIKIGRPNLQYRELPYDEAEKGLIAAGLSQDMSSQYMEMNKALNEGLITARRSAGTTTNTSFEEFCRSVFVPLFMQKKAA
jgi:uncharacterized protein YbjT (DUF2867 family)